MFCYVRVCTCVRARGCGCVCLDLFALVFAVCLPLSAHGIFIIISFNINSLFFQGRTAITYPKLQHSFHKLFHILLDCVKLQKVLCCVYIHLGQAAVVWEEEVWTLNKVISEINNYHSAWTLNTAIWQTSKEICHFNLNFSIKA